MPGGMPQPLQQPLHQQPGAQPAASAAAAASVQGGAHQMSGLSYGMGIQHSDMVFGCRKARRRVLVLGYGIWTLVQHGKHAACLTLHVDACQRLT